METKRRSEPPPKGPAPETSRHHAAPILGQDPGPGRLDDPELLAEVGRLTEPIITAARRRHGRIFGVATEAWWRADDPAKLAGVQILALAWLIHDPEQLVRERLRAMAVDLSEGLQDQRALLRRRRDAISRALRNGDGHRAVELTNHHAGDDWATVHPLENSGTGDPA